MVVVGENLRKRAELLAERGICILRDLNKYVSEIENLLKEMPNDQDLKKVARFYKTLSDPFRIKLLYILKKRPMTVCELMIALNATQPTVTRHLNILEDAGVICKRRKGRWTYCELRYKKIFDDIASVMEFLSSS